MTADRAATRADCSSLNAAKLRDRVTPLESLAALRSAVLLAGFPVVIAAISQRNQSMRAIPALLFAALCFLAADADATTCTYRIEKVDHGRLVANLFLPDTAHDAPVVIAVGGSEGGLGTGNANGELLAPHCLAVLGLAYFKEDGLPATLDHIPLEYFTEAIDFLETVPGIDASRIGFVGGSRGAELALQFAAREPRIRSLVATTPSSVAWSGRTTSGSAWTLGEQDLPSLSLGPDNGAPQVERFKAALADKEKVRIAMPALERINGPVLLVSAANDEVWPSYAMSQDVVAYLGSHNFAHPVMHRTFPTGHGFSQATAPEIKQLIIDHFVTSLALP